MKTSNMFAKGQKATAYFTGDAWVEMLITDIVTYNLVSYNVIFAPCSRNYWHQHSEGQLLYCTSGEGFYQEKGKPAQLLKVGDVVEIKPNIIHWHGATANSQFEHVGITPKASINKVTWLDPVTDEEYPFNF